MAWRLLAPGIIMYVSVTFFTGAYHHNMWTIRHLGVLANRALHPIGSTGSRY